MNPITAFLVENIVLVFFLYGLAFFVLGLALALASRRASEFRFARAIIPLAAFGILHGIHEWIEMFQHIAPWNSAYAPSLGQELIRLGILVASFLALMAFGLILLTSDEPPTRRVTWSLLAVTGIWAVAAAGVVVALKSSLAEAIALADVLARYVIGIPAALIAAWAMMAQQRTFREHGMPQFGRDLVWCATALVLYGIVGQLFVRQTVIFPSSVLNSTQFLAWFGIPVQLFRGAMAAVLAIYMVRALKAFELEDQRRLESANEARMRAQAEALETERRVGQERERLNTELRNTARELALLLELSNLLATTMSLEDRLQAVLQRVVRSLSYPDAGMILLLDGQPPEVVVKAACGFEKAQPEDLESQAQSLGERSVQTARVRCQHLDGEEHAYTFAQVMQQPRCHLYESPTIMISLPLSTQDHVIGSLVLVQSQPTADAQLTVEELELMLGIVRELGLSIENARLSLEARERERMLGELLHQVVGAQEAERQRIARELHDATGQSLTAINLGLRGVEASLQADGLPRDQIQQQVRELRSFGTTALGELRHIIADLRPAILDDMGLAAALKWYMQGFQDRWQVDGEFILEGSPLRLPAEVETVLFRIAQEALTNIAKHAWASQATLVLRFAPGIVCLIVEDDGVGFDPAKVLAHQAPRPGWGLLGIQERVALLGGQYAIDSAPGQGTRVWVTVPLPNDVTERIDANYQSATG
jgi:signal transduction histidine kinase